MTDKPSVRDTDSLRIDRSERTTISMSETVDVSNVDDETVALFQQMASLYEDLFRTFVEKNLDYGSSFVIGGELDVQRDGGPFDDSLTANLYRLYTRTGDKRIRLYQRAFGEGHGRVSDEEIGETALDAANYWILKAWLLRYGYRDETEADPEVKSP